MDSSLLNSDMFQFSLVVTVVTTKICTDEQNEEKASESLDSDDLKNNAEIENVVETSSKPLMKTKL